MDSIFETRWIQARPLLEDLVADQQLGRDSFARLILSSVIDGGDEVAGRVVNRLGPEATLRWLLGEIPMPIRLCAPKSERLERLRRLWSKRVDFTLLEPALTLAKELGVWMLHPRSRLWPEAFLDLGHRQPLLIWGRGQREALAPAEGFIGLVGSRRSLPYSVGVAEGLAKDLSKLDYCVVSGGAIGVDAAAHRGSLVGNGRGIAFMAGGLDRLYPRENSKLFDRLSESGSLLSELLCGTPVQPQRFLARNRLIAALSGALVVVQAGARSGSLNTARHAAEIGREVGVIPGPTIGSEFLGGHRLLREGLAVCLSETADMLELVQPGQ